MTVPDPANGLLPWVVELFYDGQWNDITRDVVVNDSLLISRGRKDYSDSAEPSSLSLTLANTDGKYTPRNPLSPLYGKIGRNTPIRVRLGEPDASVWFLGDPSTYLDTPDPAGELSPSGEFEIRIDLEPETWFPEQEQIIGGKRRESDAALSWVLIQNPDGHIRLLVSSPSGDLLVARGPTEDGSTRRRAIRFRYLPYGSDEIPESVGHPLVVVHQADTVDGPWTYVQSLWWPDFPGGSVIGSDAPVSLGALESGSTWNGLPLYRGTVHALQVLAPTADGSDEFLLDARFSGIAEAPSWPDETGRVWTVHGEPDWRDESVRFSGEVSEWPPRWDSPEYAETRVVANGLRRRLERTSTPLRSPMFRASTNPGDLPRTVAYWPMEDEKGSTHFASGLPSAPPMLVGKIPGYHVRDLEVAAYDGFIASDPVPEFHITSTVGQVPPAEPTGELRLFACIRIPEEGIPAHEDGSTQEVSILALRTTGTASSYSLVWNSDDRCALRIRTRADTTPIYDSGWINFTRAAPGRKWLGGIWLRQSGSSILWQIFAYPEEDAVGGAFNGTFDGGYTIGAASSVVVGSVGDLGGTAIGHVSVHNANTDSIGPTIFLGFKGNNPEPAGARLVRLASEESVPLRVLGDPANTEPLGVQQTDALMGLMDSAAEADLGSLHEARDRATLEYRPRVELYNREPLELDYAAGHVVDPLEPTDDDADLQNDVTVTRRDGSRYRVVKQTGALSVEEVGRYDASIQLDLADDAQVAHQAGWRLHLGTVNETRYPKLVVSLNGSPELVETVRKLDVGSRIVVRNLPPWLPPDTADLLVQGYDEETNGLEWTITFNCTPASPWSVGVADDPVYGRADTAGAEVFIPVTADEGLIPVLTTNGPLWTEDPEQYPFDLTVGGEIVTATAGLQLLSDNFVRSEDVGIWGDPDRGIWGDTFIWSS